MKLTVLIENRAEEALQGEHGLSVHISYGERQYLLDTGASNRFAENADKLGVDLFAVDVAVLSHGHYDHSGGYDALFARNPKVKVYLQTAAKQACYVGAGFLKKYIGLPKGLLGNHSGRFIFVDGDRQLDNGVWLIAHSTPGLAQQGKQARMVRRTPQGMQADDFSHEHSLVFAAEKGLVILNSCCHAGADIVVQEVQRALPGHPILAVVGGFHLMGAGGVQTMRPSAEEVRALGERLTALGVQQIYTCHCTGTPAFNILQSMLGDQVRYLSTGTVVEI